MPSDETRPTAEGDAAPLIPLEPRGATTETRAPDDLERTNTDVRLPGTGYEDLLETLVAESKGQLEPAAAYRIHVELGRLHECAHRPTLALEHYLKALEADPNGIVAIRSARQLELRNRQFTAAVTHFDAEIRVATDKRQRAALLCWKSRILADDLGDLEGARQALIQALELEPANLSLYKAQERLDPDKNRGPRAGKSYEKDPSYRAALLIHRALGQERDGDFEAAVLQCDEALRIDPEACTGLEILARIHRRNGDWTKLCYALERLASRSQDVEYRAGLLYELSQLQAHMLERNEDALDSLTRAVQSHPAPLYLDALAHMFAEREMLVSLLPIQQRLIRDCESPEERAVLLCAQAGLFDLLDRRDDAIDALESALAAVPGHRVAAHNLSRLLEYAERWEQLIENLARQAGVSRDPRQAAAIHEQIAGIYERKLKQPAEAIEHHVRALGQYPDYEPSFRALSRLYQETENYGKLADLYEQCAEMSTDESRKAAYLLHAASILQHHANDGAAAARLLKRTLNAPAGPHAAELYALQTLQQSLESTEDWQGLAATLEREARLHDNHELAAQLLYRAGMVLLEELGDTTAARSRFEQALGRSASFGPAREQLALALAGSGRWSDVATLRQAQLNTTTGPERAEIACRLAVLTERRLGDDRRALEYYEQALEAQPGHVQATLGAIRLLKVQKDWRKLALLLEAHLAGLRSTSARARVLCQLGDLWETHLRDPETAMRHFEAALAADPRLRFPSQALQRIYTRQKLWDKLLPLLEGELRICKDEQRKLTLLLQLGELRDCIHKDVVGAVRVFRTAGKCDEGQIPAFIALETMFIRRSSWPELIGLYAEQISNVTNDELRLAILREVARMLELRPLENIGPRIAAYNKIWEHAPRDPSPLLALEILAHDAEDDELLIKTLTRLAESSNDIELQGHYFARLGLVLEGVRDSDAQEAFRKAAAVSPQLRASYRGLRRLAERKNDDVRAANAARQEADLTNDPQRAAALYTLSASLRLKGGKDRESALIDIEKALNRSPGSEEIIALLDGSKLEPAETEIRLLSDAANRVENQQRKAALWEVVANRHAAKDHDEQAIAALHRALEANPGMASAIRRLAELYKKTEQWGMAVLRLEQCLESITDKKLEGELRVTIAEVLYRHLNNPKEALAHLEAALARDEENPALWQALADCRAQNFEPELALTAARRALDLCKDPTQRGQILVTLARLNLKRGQTSEAQTLLTEALALLGPNQSGTVLLRDLARQSGDWSGYTRALRDYLKRAKKRNITGPELATAYLYLAESLEDSKTDPSQVIELLEEGLGATEGAVEVRRALITRLRRARRFTPALEHLKTLQASNPSMPFVWEETAKTLQEAGRDKDAAIALAPLEVMGLHTGASNRAARVSRPGQVPPRFLDVQTLETLSVDNCLTEGATALLASCSAAIEQIYKRDLSRYGLTQGDRINRQPNHPLFGLTSKVSAIFGLQVEVYEHSGDTPLVTIEMIAPACVVVSRSLQRLSPAQQTFLLAGAMAELATQTYQANKVTPEELFVLLGACARVASPDYVPPAPANIDMLKPLAERIERTLPPGARKQFELAAAKYIARPIKDVARWRMALKQTALRAALFVTDDLTAGISALKRQELLTNLDGPTLVKTSPAVADLLCFWVSDAARTLRTRAGLD